MKLFVRALITVASVLGIGWGAWAVGRGAPALAAPQATITITQPDGVGDVVGEGHDFATDIWGDPWDMNESTDIINLQYLTGESFAGGLLTYTKQPAPADRVALLFPGMGGGVNIGKLGVNYKIDASYYKWLSFRINQPNTHISIAWYTGSIMMNGTVIRIDNTTPGWGTYVVNLGEQPAWTGQLTGLAIVPYSVADGTQIQFDWARLTADNPAANSLDIAWSGLSPEPSTVSFYLDSDTSGCDGPLIGTVSNAAASGTFSWQQAANGVASPSNVAPGNYYVCAKVGGSLAGYSSGQLTVNQAPVIHFTQPSFTSGDDYATDQGNAWDMSTSADIDHITNGSSSFSGGNLKVTATATQTDVQVHLTVPNAIDSSRYYYLTYRLLYTYPFTWHDVGQGTRVFWGRAGNTETQSDWIHDFPGWQTYTIDLRSLPRDFGPTWTTGDWTIFRMDPIANNTGQTVNFYLDDVKLTGDEKADTTTDVKWDLLDPDTSVITMTLYYDSNQTGLNGARIFAMTLTNGVPTTWVPRTRPVSAPVPPVLGARSELTPTIFLPMVRNEWNTCAGTCYGWNTSNVPAGSYYLYACLNDGYNDFCRYSESKLIISH